MPDMTDDEIDSFLREPRDAVLSVVLPSGRAMGTPIWFRWVDGAARFQSPTTSTKTKALRTTGRASLCVHDQPLPVATYVTLEGPVNEVEFDLDVDIRAAALHYLGEGAESFMRGIEQALASGRRWASFELAPTSVIARTQRLG
jgi:Pyridoxamine 5'-phosphate oxidase